MAKGTRGASIDDVTASGTERPSRSRRTLRALCGPLLIVAATLAAMHGYAFGGKLSQYPDELAWWLPNYCSMGQALRGGHIPLWNPTTLAGTPFAANPQTGWLYLPVMLLFSILPCASAMRWFIVLQPVGAGLGLYWFLRSEGLSRVAATAGGLALALPIAGSIISLSIPFSGTFAWAALMLAAASRLMHARAWPSRLLWILATAAAWGQLAAAHLTFGLAIGTGALAAYLVARIAADLRADRAGAGRIAAALGLLLIALPAVNAGYLLPRLAYIPHTTLSLGYVRLQQLSDQLWGHPWNAETFGGGLDPARPLGFASSPGLYVGAPILLLSFAGFFAKRLRGLAIAFGAFGLAFYVLALKVVARNLGPHVASSRLGNTYLHEPHWLEFALILALPVLGAVGIEAWLRASSVRTRLLMLIPGMLVWWGLPLVAGRYHGYAPLFVIGSAVAAVALVTCARRPAVAPALACLLAAELLASVFMGEARVRPPPGSVAIGARAAPELSPDAFLAEGPIARAIASAPGRYLSIAPQAWVTIGLHTKVRPQFWPLLAMQQSITFGLRSAQGYDPLQELGYWEFVRASDRARLKYNVSYFKHVDPVALDLLQVSDVISANGHPPVANATAVATQGDWTDYRLPDPAPLASVVSAWSVVSSTEGAVSSVAGGSVQLERRVLVDREPAFVGSRLAGGTLALPANASVRSFEAQRVVLTVDAPQRSIILVRQPYDSNWHATVDGRPADVLRADGFLQGVAVQPGHHAIELRYTEPKLAEGLLITLVAVALLAGAAAAGALRASRRPDGGGHPGHGDPGHLERG